MTLTNDDELFRRSYTQLDVFSPTKSKPVCDAHGQLLTAKTRNGYSLTRLLKEIQNKYGVLIKDVGTNLVIPKRRSTESEQYPFFFYVDNIKNALKDTSENLHFHLCAYIGKGWTILRETKFEVSPLALLSYKYEYAAENAPFTKYHIGLKLNIPELSATEYASKEAVLDYLTKLDSLKLKCTISNVPYDSQWSDGQYRQEFVSLAEFVQIDVPIVDDLGEEFTNFNGAAQINYNELPELFTEHTYILDNKDNTAPLTTKDQIYCLLYADKRNLVRVLRWLPTTKADMNEQPLLPLYELGTVSAEQSEILYEAMTTTKNTLLFGSIIADSIAVICNMDGYYKSELSNIVLPTDLFNLAK